MPAVDGMARALTIGPKRNLQTGGHQNLEVLGDGRLREVETAHHLTAAAGTGLRQTAENLDPRRMRKAHRSRAATVRRHPASDSWRYIEDLSSRYRRYATMKIIHAMRLRKKGGSNACPQAGSVPGWNGHAVAKCIEISFLAAVGPPCGSLNTCPGQMRLGIADLLLIGEIDGRVARAVAVDAPGTATGVANGE